MVTICHSHTCSKTWLSISHTARPWSTLHKETPFCPSSIHPYTSSLYLPHQSSTHELLHFSTYKPLLTSINTLISSSHNHFLWHHGKILLFNSVIKNNLSMYLKRLKILVCFDLGFSIVWTFSKEIRDIAKYHVQRFICSFIYNVKKVK